MSDMTCSIVIPTRRRAPILAGTLDSLAPQSVPGLEVIVVCDGEDPETEALAVAYSAPFILKWIFTADNRGPAAARNQGAEAATGELLMFLDDDSTVEPDWAFQHLKHHQARAKDDACIVRGKVVHASERVPFSKTDQFLMEDRRFAEINSDEIVAAAGIDTVGRVSDRCRYFGLNSSINRSVFLKSGGFDPDLRFTEDMELGYRLYDLGIETIFEPAAVSHHNETKRLGDHFRWTCEQSGRVQAYRAFRKGQRNAQAYGLVSLRRRNPLWRLKLSLYWNQPESLRRTANLLRKATDYTGSKRIFRAWLRFEVPTGYWQGVKSEGLKLRELGKLIGKPFSVLSFGSISVPQKPVDRKWTLSPKRFLRMMRILHTLGYRSIDPTENLSLFVGRRCFVLTFEGYEDFYFEVFPNIERLKLKPLVFLPLDYMGRTAVGNDQTGYVSRKVLSVRQVVEMHARGVHFGCCGRTHSWLPGLSDADLRREVTESKARLEDLLGSEVCCFAYPGGGVDSRVRGAVARAGYKFGYSSRPGLNLWEDRLVLKRTTICECDTASDLVLKVATGRSIRDTLAPLMRFVPATCT